jgi:hypothetical protein
VVALCAIALFGSLSVQAQANNGGIQGRVTDKSGAVIPKAEVTATNTDTGVQTSDQANGAGEYSLAPLQPGNYNLEVVAKGFERLLQENITVDATAIQRYDAKLSAGGENTTVTVTDAPPFLNTTDSTLGGTIENELYTQLPISMNGGPRDPTAFQYLMPGVQENPANNSGQGAQNGNSGIYGGSGATNLNENYIDGVPVPSINQGGNSNPVSGAVSVDAVDQFSVQTNGASAAFGGAGSTNFTIKSGGNQFHGTVFDFVRNTIFDTWGYFAKVPNGGTGIAEKPGEHQNSYGGSLGGPIIKDRLFFFGSYEGYHLTRTDNTPQYESIPTLAERTGNFTDVYGNLADQIYDPTIGVSHGPLQGLLNGVPTFNVIPQTEISPISQYLQSGCVQPEPVTVNPSGSGYTPAQCPAGAGTVPLPTNLALFNNYLAGLPLANQDYTTDARLDYTLNSRNKFSVDALGGNIGYDNQPNYNGLNQLPPPYSSGFYQSQKQASGILTYNLVISQTMVNSLKYGFTRTWGNRFSITQGKFFPGTQNAENAAAAGINNLPAGNATTSMPNVQFQNGAGAQPAPFSCSGCTNGWQAQGNQGPQATNSFTAIDQLVWNKGRHNITFALQVQWLETNGGAFGGYSNTLNLNYKTDSTNAPPGSSGSGDAYASFLLGAVNNGSVTAQTIQDVGARYRPITPYIQDNWRVTPKLTLNLGIRYDYFQPYHEVQDRISFLDVNVMNPIVGIPGVTEYAGFPGKGFYSQAVSGITPSSPYNNYICHCTTPVHPYNKNFEPSVGFAYAANATTVFSGGFSVHLTHVGGSGGGSNTSGGVNQGGGGSSTVGTNNGGLFSATTNFSETGSTTPAFFLNPLVTASGAIATYFPPSTQGTQPLPPSGSTTPSPNIPCVAAGTCSPYSAVPQWTVPGVSVNPLSTTGNYAFVNYFAQGSPFCLANSPSSGITCTPVGTNQYGCQTGDNQTCTGQGVNFADPYYGGRGGEFINYNFGMQKQINKKAVLSLSYAGSQSHFLPGGSGRGPANNEFSPDYNLALLETMRLPAASEEAVIQSIFPNYKLPYPAFTGTGATVAASLTPFPQFANANTSNLNDIWGDTGNSSYNSFQMLLIQRPWHNLSGFMDYTRAKEIDDLGNHRSQYPIGPQDGNFTRTYSANEIDRGLGNTNQTNAFNLTFVYAFPFGRGQAFFASNRIMGLIAGGWTINGLYKSRDGYPIQVSTSGGCDAIQNGGGMQKGTCMPDQVPGFNKQDERVNGRWGRGPGSNATTAATIPYLNPNGFECPDSNPSDIGIAEGSTAASPGNQATCGANANTSGSETFKTGNAARSAPYDIHGPGWWDVDLGLRRTFSVRETATLHLTFQFEADVFNATNSTFFNLGGTNWNSGGFGTVGGQNASVLPRDWQFAGRFRF